MGKIRKPTPVKLICGLIFKNEKILEEAESLLEKHFGSIDFQGKILPFNHTDYYEGELGKNLKRKFIGFKKLILPSRLPQIKVITNKIEEDLSEEAGRLINIDPGYLDLSKLVLASTKDYKHRLYLNRGVYAEVTLFYQNKTFRGWEWTYPDYKSEDYIAIFNQIREIFAKQIKNE